MPKRNKLETGVPWVELKTTAADWKSADPELLATMLGQIQLIRAFEETVLDLAGQGQVLLFGQITCAGQLSLLVLS